VARSKTAGLVDLFERDARPFNSLDEFSSSSHCRDLLLRGIRRARCARKRVQVIRPPVTRRRRGAQIRSLASPCHVLTASGPLISDQDLFGHVNHANMVTLLEEARVPLLFVDGSSGLTELVKGW